MSEVKKVNRGEESKKLVEQVKDLEALNKLESQVVDNTIEFKINKKEEKRNYRVRMPTIREKMEINQKRLSEKNRLHVAGFLYEAELIQDLYEKQGKDVKKLSKEILDITEEINVLRLKLATEQNKDHRERLVNLIDELKNDQTFKIGQKSEYLETSIEAQLTEIMITHFASLIFEKKAEDKWVRVFKSYDDYIDCKDPILASAAVNYVYKLLF